LNNLAGRSRSSRTSNSNVAVARVGQVDQLISVSTATPSRKRPPEGDPSACGSSLSTTSTSGLASVFTIGSNNPSKDFVKGLSRSPQKQMRLCSNAIDPQAPEKMDVALATLVHSKGLSFNLPEDPLFANVISIARTLGERYKPPGKDKVAGVLLNEIHNTENTENLDTIVDEARIYGVVGYGDLATIDKYAFVNFLAAGPNNSFGILDIADCSEHCAKGEKKSGEYIAGKFTPLIQELEDRVDNSGKKCKGMMDLMLFDGGSNVQKCGRIMAAQFPRLTVLHGAEHALALMFSDIYNKVGPYKRMANICRKARNVFGSTRHAPTAMFRKKAKEHNNGKKIGLIKVSECR